MGTHPNTLIMAVITPDQGSRKTQRSIFQYCQEKGIKCDIEDGTIGILNGNKGAISDQYPEGYPFTDDWKVQVMESDYDEGYQISADEGQIVVHDYVTYGYGDKTSWQEIEAKRQQLIDLIEPMTNPLEFSYEIFIGANYW